MRTSTKINTLDERIHLNIMLIEANTRIAFLRSKLNRLNHLYYVIGASDVQDSDYDALYSELAALEQRHPELADPASPTQRIGAPTSGMATVKHAVKMLSLKNTYNPQEVLSFFKSDQAVVVEPKIDGISLKVIYKKGKFEQAVTRGDGAEGEDATASAKTILSLPMVLAEPVDLTIVGEVYMRYSVFNVLNDKLEKAGEDLFANPRNAAAGSLKLKDPAEVASRNLSFVAYGIHTQLKGMGTQSGITNYLKSLGFQTVDKLPVAVEGTPTLFDLLHGLGDLKLCIDRADELRKGLDLATDGLVFKLNELVKQRELGDGTKYPNHSCAFKYPPERKPTLLLGITVQVGRTGKVTPVAELEPVPLSGTVVRRASLCNADEIARLNINIGDRVGVEKAAEIIPKVMSLVEKKSEGPYKFPSVCPCCQNKLVKPEGFVDWYCPNRDCDDQVFARLRHATCKGALDIDGCGEALIRELMNHGVRSLSQLFGINNLDFLKPAARQKFETNREKAKRAPYWRKIHAMGIEGIGSSLSQAFAARWPNIPAAMDDAELLKKELGEVNYIAFGKWLTDNIDEIGDLENVEFHLDRGTEATGPLVGKVFCITGQLISATRDIVEDRIIAAGGVCKGSVSKTVDYLVVGAEAGKTKTIAAERHKTKIITEEQLYALMGVPMPTASTIEEKEY
jgi:DNA ligase (NAD+)